MSTATRTKSQCFFPLKSILSDFLKISLSISSDLQVFLNQDWVRKEIGVEPSLGNFTWISTDVNSGFWASGDPLYQNSHYVAELLERGVRVLIYAGTNDWIANWVGNERWTLEMWWSGQEGYVSKPLIDWSVDGNVAGKVRSYGDLTFATIYGAGHLVSIADLNSLLRYLIPRRYLETNQLKL